MFCKRKWRVYLHYTDDSLGFHINLKILNDDTPFFVKESAIWISVGFQTISAIFFFLDHFSQNSHLYAKSFVQKLGWVMYQIIERGIVSFAEDFDVITIVFQLQYL